MENQKVIVPDCLKGMKYLHPGYGPAFRKMLEPPDVAADFINSILHTDKGCNAVNLTATFEKPVDVFYPEKKRFSLTRMSRWNAVIWMLNCKECATRIL